MSSSDPGPDGFQHPQSITGGCLCGSLRYKVEFSNNHDFLKNSGSCQCTQCRRCASSLVWFSHEIPAETLTFTTPTSTLKNFHATKEAQRGFCTNCGSFLYFQVEGSDRLDLSLGCVDPEYLIGGEGSKEQDGYGYALANCSGDNVFCENEIKGVTSGWVGKEGKRWAKLSKDGIPA